MLVSPVKLLLFIAVSIATISCQGQTLYLEGSPKLAIWELGRGKETIIVLHGGPGAAHNYLLPEWNALTSSGKLVFYDQRGCGKSERAACYSWREHINDLKRIIAYTSKGQSVVLAGSSWGSTLALLYAYIFPGDVKGIILSGTYNWIGEGLPPKNCDAYLPLATQLLQRKDSFKLLALKSKLPATNGATKYYEAHTVSHNMTVNSMAEAPTLAQLASIKHRVLIFKGDESCMETPVKEGADLYKRVLVNAQVFEMPGTCHDPWLDKPDLFFQKANGFIQTLR